MIGFESFKGRAEPAMGTRVRVHRNLNRRGAVWWSITPEEGPDSGRVVGYARGLTLVDAGTKVNLAAQARIADGAAREVHAWVVGSLSEERKDWPLSCPIHYRPRRRPEFFDRHGVAFTGADTVIFNEEGMFA